LLMYNGLIWISDNDTLRLRILRDHYDAQAAGHPGRAKTLELVSRNFYWPRQRKYIHRYVDHSDTCHRIKPIRHVLFGLLKPLELPHQPWDTISMDFITALPTSNGKDALWVIIDRLMKMGYFIACHGTMNPEDLADHFRRQIIRPHGLPSSIISDRGSLFTSDFWKRVMECRRRIPGITDAAPRVASMADTVASRVCGTWHTAALRASVDRQPHTSASTRTLI